MEYDKFNAVRAVFSGPAGEVWRGLLTDWMANHADSFTMSELQNIATTVRDCGAMKFEMGVAGIFTLTREDFGAHGYLAGYNQADADNSPARIAVIEAITEAKIAAGDASRIGLENIAAHWMQKAARWQECLDRTTRAVRRRFDGKGGAR